MRYAMHGGRAGALRALSRDQQGASDAAWAPGLAREQAPGVCPSATPRELKQMPRSAHSRPRSHFVADSLRPPASRPSSWRSRALGPASRAASEVLRGGAGRPRRGSLSGASSARVFGSGSRAGRRARLSRSPVTASASPPGLRRSRTLLRPLLRPLRRRRQAPAGRSALTRLRGDSHRCQENSPLALQCGQRPTERCRRTDWQLRSTPCCDGKWLVRASTCRLIVFRSGAGCWPGRFGTVRRGQPPPDNCHLARLSY